MAWSCRTIAPARSGSNYLVFITHPNGYSPEDPTLTGDGTGYREYTFPYVSDPNGNGGTDIWDSGIPYTGRDPHQVSMNVTVDSGGKDEVETPEVADGAGGGGTRMVLHKARVLVSFRHRLSDRKPPAIKKK